jgi:hypothetical protein
MAEIIPFFGTNLGEEAAGIGETGGEEMVSIFYTKSFSVMTEKQTKIIEFIKSSKEGKRYLCEFEKIIEVK